MKKTIGKITNKLTGEVLSPYKKDLQEEFKSTIATHLCCRKTDVSFFDECDMIKEWKKFTNLDYKFTGTKYELISGKYNYSTTCYNNMLLVIFYLIKNNLD